MKTSLQAAGRIRLALLFALFAATVGAKGCDSNYIGVQDYGSVVGRVIDAKTNLPIGGVLVNVGSLYVTRSAADGTFTLPKVPVGSQEVDFSATGYQAAPGVTVAVAKDQANAIDQPVKLTPVTP